MDEITQKVLAMRDLKRSLNKISLELRIPVKRVRKILVAEGRPVDLRAKMDSLNVEDVYADYTSGLCERELADKYRCSMSLMHNFMEKYGLKRRRMSDAVRLSYRKLSDCIRADLEGGLSEAELARKYFEHFHKPRVKALLEQHGYANSSANGGA